MNRQQPSDTFNSPPRGTALNRINEQFDSITASLDSLQSRAENAFQSISDAIGEVRESIEEKRTYVIRGAIPDDTFDLTIIPDDGEFRWCWLVSAYPL